MDYQRNPTFNLQVYDIGPQDPRAKEIYESNIRLKPHQQALLQKCIAYETGNITFKSIHPFYKKHPAIQDTDYMYTNIGIIGDKVGAGKSYVILSLIMNEHNLEKRQYTLQSYGNNKVMVQLSDQTALMDTNIIVVPHNLCNQWNDYVKSFSENINYTVISNRKAMEPFIKNPLQLQDNHLVILTASLHNPMAHLLTLNNIKVSRVIYDEVDSINIPSSMEIMSKFYWFVTASYGNLLYPRGYRSWDQRTMRYVYHATGIRNSGFIKDLFMDLSTSLKRDYMNVLVLKNDDTFVDQSFQLVDPVTHIVLSKEPTFVNVLNGLVDIDVMECLNAGDEQSAIQLIDPRRRNTESNIINALIQKYDAELHNIDIQLNAVTAMTFMNVSDQQARVARLEEKKTTLQAKIQSIKERVETTSMCCICYDDIKHKSVTPCCSNSYCFACIHVWINLNNSCPLCKARMTQEDILVVNDGIVDVPAGLSEPRHLNEFNPDYDKIQNLMILLRRRSPTSKFLVFSNYEHSFRKITRKLTDDNIQYAFLKGNKYQIENKLQEYRTGSLQVLLINGSFYGSGLNLENTTDLVLFHKCNSEIEKQVIGRAQRLGRTCALNIWYLIHENEVNSTNETPPAAADSDDAPSSSRSGVV
jgi:hypothetical protein